MEKRRSGDDSPLNLDELTEAVWQRLMQRQPDMLLIGDAPENYHKFNYVKLWPYDGILLGYLSPAQLLHMPDEAVCQALLDGKPVYFWQPQRYHGRGRGSLLRQELRKAEQYLFQLGVQPMGLSDTLITARQMRILRQQGLPLPQNSRLTPLAKDILEGRTL